MINENLKKAWLMYQEITKLSYNRLTNLDKLVIYTLYYSGSDVYGIINKLDIDEEQFYEIIYEVSDWSVEAKEDGIEKIRNYYKQLFKGEIKWLKVS